jgi:Flp pilus assembly protein TadB
MTNFDPIGLWLAASVVVGVAAHVALAARSRRAYRRLRDAYAGAVSAAQQTGAVDALVLAQELHREFMRTTPPPGWLTGLGARLKAALVLCAVAGVAAMVATGRLPPVVAGVAVLLAIGLRRILLATALLLALFVATNMVSPPRRAERTPATAHSAPPSAPKALGHSR